MAFSLVAHTSVSQVGSSNTTTGSINTTGATLLVAVLSGFTGIGTLTDSKGNTWIGRTLASVASSVQCRIFYCINPTVGSGHTFTIAGSFFTALQVAAWSAPGAVSYDTESTATDGSGSSTTPKPGSVTPTNINSLIVAGCSFGVSGNTTSAVDSGFTQTDAVVGTSGNSVSGAEAYIIETSIVAKNPQFTINSASKWAACSAVFATAGAVVNETITLAPTAGFALTPAATMPMSVSLATTPALALANSITAPMSVSLAATPALANAPAATARESATFNATPAIASSGGITIDELLALDASPAITAATNIVGGGSIALSSTAAISEAGGRIVGALVEFSLAGDFGVSSGLVNRPGVFRGATNLGSPGSFRPGSESGTPGRFRPGSPAGSPEIFRPKS